MKIHVVQKGDTLWNIAKKYNVSFEELKAVNTQLSNPDMIMPGMKIKIPSNTKAKKEVVVKESVVEHPYTEQKPQAPKMQYQPMPMPIPQQKPIMMQPEVDIHQTYNIQLHQAKMQMPQYQQPQMQQPQYQVPQFPMPELPKAPLPPKEVKKVKEVKEVKEMKEEPPVQAMPEAVMPQMMDGMCYPISPVMPGDGFHWPMPHHMPMPQVQGAQFQPQPQPQVQGAQMMPPGCEEMMGHHHPHQVAGMHHPPMKKPCGCGGHGGPPQMMPYGGPGGPGGPGMQPMPYGMQPHMGGFPPGMGQQMGGYPQGAMPSQMGGPQQGMGQQMGWNQQGLGGMYPQQGMNQPPDM